MAEWQRLVDAAVVGVRDRAWELKSRFESLSDAEKRLVQGFGGLALAGSMETWRRTRMSYRNKTYVAFASEDIRLYRLMEAWRENDKIDFNFYDAHDLYVARDTSKPETIRARLRERMKNAKQVVLIGSPNAKKKGADEETFLGYEVKTIIKLNLPVVVANHDGDRKIDRNFIPRPFLDADYYTISVSLQPRIIKYALDNYAPKFASSSNSGPHYYKAETYADLGL